MDFDLALFFLTALEELYCFVLIRLRPSDSFLSLQLIQLWASLLLTSCPLSLSRLPLLPWLASELQGSLSLSVHRMQMISGRFEVIPSHLEI